MTDQKGIVNIHGKDYMTVARRVELAHEDKSFERLFTEVLSNDPVVIRATVMIKGKEFTGISSVPTDSGKMIEKQNPYEVAETSAVGRALGFANYGIIESVASADEVHNATQYADSKFSKGTEGRATAKQIGLIRKLLKDKGHTEKEALIKYEVTDLEQLTGLQASTIIENLLKLVDVTIQ